MDLLLYLVRKHEVEIVDIPISTITDQYLEYLAVLEQLDVNAVGDFLAVAATLIEIKSQQVLPRGDEVQDEVDDPRQELVQRLLEYKKYRDAASILEERSRDWQQHYPAPDQRPARTRAEPGRAADPRGGAMGPGQRLGRIIRDTAATKPANIVYDDTPIQVYMARIHARLWSAGNWPSATCSTPGMHKSAMVGIFLAVLELVRHHRVRVEQNELFGEVWLLLDPECREPLDLSERGQLRTRCQVPRMIDNPPVRTLVHKGLTIEGYSRAAVQSYWRIPELKLGFDLGAQPWSFMATSTWFITHTHLDHIAALPVYVARRRMMKMEPPTIYLPEAAIEPIERLLQAVQPARPRPAALHAAAGAAGRRDRAVARARRDRLDHLPHAPALGFVVWERRRKLKHEYPRPARREDPRPAALGGWT